MPVKAKRRRIKAVILAASSNAPKIRAMKKTGLQVKVFIDPLALEPSSKRIKFSIA